MISGITMDGVKYRVRIVYDSMENSFRLEEGHNAGTMLSGRKERDLIGTYYGHSMQVEPDPAYPDDFDVFFDAISAPVDSHRVSLPYGQGTIDYDAMVTSGRRINGGKMLGKTRWHGLEVQYEPIEPQRVPE